MSWIKVDLDFPDHPKVLKLAKIMGISQDQAVVLLLRWFIWVKKYCPTGKLLSDIEMPVRDEYGTFPVALRESGWVRDGWVNDWVDYGGAEAAEKAKRNPEEFMEMIDFYRIIPYGMKTVPKRDENGTGTGRLDQIRLDQIRPSLSITPAGKPDKEILETLDQPKPAVTEKQKTDQGQPVSAKVAARLFGEWRMKFGVSTDALYRMQDGDELALDTLLHRAKDTEGELLKPPTVEEWLWKLESFGKMGGDWAVRMGWSLKCFCANYNSWSKDGIGKHGTAGSKGQPSGSDSGYAGKPKKKEFWGARGVHDEPKRPFKPHVL